MKILILASNPRKDLNLDDEIRLLRNVIDRSRDRDQFEIVSEPGVRVGDLQRLLLQHKPEIVHFCGHGGGKEGLIFKRDEGGEQWVQADALANMFGLNPICNYVECVLLNACYSEEQANAIVSRINYVVGMSHEIQDNAAIAFSKGFYLALGEGCSINDAFEFGKNAIQLEISGSSKMRSATTEAARKAEVVDAIQHTAIPEHLKPILKIKPTLTSNLRTNITAPAQALSQETRVAIQLGIDKSLAIDAKVKQYREVVREYLEDHRLADFERVLLEELRRELGLSIEVVEKILDEEQAPIWAAQQAYCKILNGLIQNGFYPFHDDIKSTLKKEQARRRLIDEEVAEISQSILEAAEIAYQAKQAQQRAQQEYEQEFVRATASQFPPSISTRENLKQLQESLRLSDEDVTRIEEPIVAAKKVFVEDLGEDVTLEMVAIEGGTFIMGWPDHKLERSGSEEHQHHVTVQPFFIGKFAVTQAQWKIVATRSKVEIDLSHCPSFFKGDKRPVESVSWHQATEFCNRLSQQTGKTYRLPSEAEWEYACRAGTDTLFYFGELIVPELANYNGSNISGVGSDEVYREQTTEVGCFPANAFGLYDMHGNVQEWCADHWHENYQGAPSDGSAWVEGGSNKYRLARGGSWVHNPYDCQSAYRSCYDRVLQRKYLGFRVVCVLA
jgi:formylglycine-generating enzyme required for sulfatase activity